MGRLREFRRTGKGAVAPTVALSLFGLIAVGGIAFDYARLASLDTELQNAADQAALAAATQLDGNVDACARASAAAVTFLANQTLMANDGDASGRAVTVPSEPDCDDAGLIRFYQDKEKTDPADDDSNAHFVEVEVNGRRAYYALTPIVAAIRSQPLTGIAFAGVRSAICKVPPVMICNPDEPEGNIDDELEFSLSGKIGVGMRLIGDGSYAPGNFGYLQTGFGNGANALLEALGSNTPPGDCIQIDDVTTETGMKASVMDGLNTRFDIIGTNGCPGGSCSPSINVRKDLVRNAGNCNWEEATANATEMASSAPPRYRPTSAAALPSGTTPIIMGHPRDLCHAWSEAGNCTGGASGRIGNGIWDRAAYFRSNHPSVNYTSEAGLGTNVTRYQTYLWEIGNINTRLAAKSAGGGKSSYSTPQAGMCRAPGLTPGGAVADRRRISAAVINCEAEGVSGHTEGVHVTKWIDLFLVEPSMERKMCNGGAGGCNTKYTDKTDVYVEVIGETEAGASGSVAGQVTRHDVPYLIE